MTQMQRSAIGLLSAILFLFSSCTSREIDRPPPSTLIPFFTSTTSPVSPTGTVQTPEGLVAAETPLPTPTPFAYTVQQGDTISSIALEFGISMDDLIAANPEISPNIMPVGQVINIPGNLENPSGEPTPTPAPFTIQQIQCYPTADSGMWCFVLVHNDLPDLIENVSAQVTLINAGGAAIAGQTALLPLNILPANTSLPLAVFFPPEVPVDAKPQVQVLTAIRLLPGDQRYLPAGISNTLVQLTADGRSALVTGQVLLPVEAAAATQVWVAATAYDETGRVTGMRKWEWNEGLSPGGSLPFAFTISSLEGRIERVEFAVEARP